MRESGLLDGILRPSALAVEFQPVIDASGLLLFDHYQEGLIRGPRGTPLESPEVLFEVARLEGGLAGVDRACVDAVLAAAHFLPGAPRLGIHLQAPTLAFDADVVGFLRAALERHGFAPSRLVVEIVGDAPAWSMADFRQALAELRAVGVRTALDDVGFAQSSYRMMLECRPDYFKIDRYFVTGSHADVHRRAVLRSISELARHFGAQPVAEGVETPKDLEAAKDAGIGFVQGWLFGPARPASAVSWTTAPHPHGHLGG